MNHLLIIQCIWHSIFKLPPFSILHKYWSIQLSNHSHPVGKVFSSNQIDEIKSSKKRLEYQVGKYLMSGMCLQQYFWTKQISTDAQHEWIPYLWSKMDHIHHIHVCSIQNGKMTVSVNTKNESTRLN